MISDLSTTFLNSGHYIGIECYSVTQPDTNYYGHAAENKVNIQKLIVSSREKGDFEIKSTILFTVAPLKIKDLGINLIKYV